MTAFDILAAGLSVLPIDPNTKRPPIKGCASYPEATRWGGYPWTDFMTRLPTPEEVEEFLVRFPDCWLGFATGEGSGNVEAFDFDIPGKKHFAPGQTGVAPSWEPFCQLVREHNFGYLLDRLTIVQTRSGGIQFYIRSETPVGSKALAKRPATAEELAENPTEKAKVLIETRGLKGLVVAPPSPGYRFLQGDFTTIPTLANEERAVLWALACSFDETPQPEPIVSTPKTKKSRPEGDVRPGDDFENRATWEEILEPHGYRKVGRMYGGMQLWAHSGKAPGEWSARTGPGKAGDRFFSWSPNGGVPDNRLLTKFGLYAFLNFPNSANPFEDAATALAKQGYGSQSRRPKASAVAMDDRSSDMEDNSITDEIGSGRGDFPLTDVGNARRLVHHYGSDLRYCSDWGRWLTYDQVRWAEDSQDNKAARGMAQSLTDIMRDDPSEAVQKHGTRSQETSKISAMLREAQVALGVRSADLDRHDHLLAFKNGVVDLRTGQLVENPRDLLITKACATYWDPTAKCPRFDDFLIKVTKERAALVAALLRALGYSLTGDTGAHKFFLMYGPRARNGKSTIQGLLDSLLGPQLCGAINKKLLTDSGKDSARFAVAGLEGRRVVHANENTKGRTFDTEFLKEFSGGTRMQAERKGKDEYTIAIKAKLWLSVNDLPAADWTDSYASRVFPFPFEQSFYNQDNPLYRPGDLPDLGRQFQDNLIAEGPGIMATLVRLGSIPYYNDGGLIMPPEIKALLDSYRVANDYIGQWIAERCVSGGHTSHRIAMSSAFADFRDFIKKENLPWKGRINEFSTSLQNRPGLGHVSPGNRSTVTGIALRSALDEQWANHKEDLGL